MSQKLKINLTKKKQKYHYDIIILLIILRSRLFPLFSQVTCSKTNVEDWGKFFHPAYYPDGKVCDGFANVPLNVSCAKDEGGTGDEGAQRVCLCIDPGTEILFSSTGSKCFLAVCNFKDTITVSCPFQRKDNNNISLSLFTLFLL